MKRFNVFIIGLLLLSACHSDPPMVIQPSQPGNVDLKEHMINANRTISRAEETSIDEYVSRRGWSMSKLDDGTRLWEYKVGGGRNVEVEDSVTITYDIEAINGKPIYNDLQETFVAGRRQKLIGLDNAVLHLRYGSCAKVILPSSVAYGIGGDGDRIPQSAILVIDLQIKQQ